MLVQLEADGFRNLESFAWTGTSGSHLILGDNGAGKTSFLEAVYLLATTRSFRTPQLVECCRHGTRRFRLAGEVESTGRYRLELAFEGGGTHRRLNGSRSSLAEHLAPLPVVCWTAESGEILSGSPSHRRRFVDRGLLGLRPTAIASLARYRRTLEEKRRLLQGAQGPLEPWNRLLAEAIAELSSLRAAYVTELAAMLLVILEECALDLPPVELEYQPSPRCAADGVEAIERRLGQEREKEKVMGRPLLGSHRDEMVIRWSRTRVRRMASAGERKVLGLALLAAQGRLMAARGRQPLYLLDDVDTELDPSRLAAIWRAFAGAEQLIATSNRSQVWRRLGVGRYWTCTTGRLSERGSEPL